MDDAMRAKIRQALDHFEPADTLTVIAEMAREVRDAAGDETGIVVVGWEDVAITAEQAAAKVRAVERVVSYVLNGGTV